MNISKLVEWKFYKALLGFGIIPALVLSPFNFSIKDVVVSWDILALRPGTEDDFEIMLNILLYIPFGFGLTGYFHRESSKIKVFLSVVIICFALSYVCEILQSLLPSRHPSWRDVASNTAGGMLGWFGTVVWQRKNTVLLFGTYVVAVCVIGIVLQRTTTLKNWNPSYPLLVGNERTGNRPWRGIVTEFFVGNRALEGEEIQRLHAAETRFPFVGDSLVVYYKENGASDYRDQTENAPPIAIRRDLSLSPRHESAWFENSAAGKYITESLSRSTQFTLGATITSQDSDQKGPARIISLSEDPNTRNFTLGQAGHDLVVRLRTPVTGENGVHPELRVPSVFAVSKPIEAIVTYDAMNLFVYIDGVKSAYSLELTPAMFAYKFVTGADAPRSIMVQLLYYGMLFSPAGILLGLAIGESCRVCHSRAIIIGAVILFIFAAFLEALQVIVSGRHIQLCNVFLGTVFGWSSHVPCLVLLRCPALEYILKVDQRLRVSSK